MPNKAIIELHCQRIPKETTYNGELLLRNVPGALPVQALDLAFQEELLENVAVWLHHLVRLLALSGTEFCVRMFQKAPKSTKPAVAMDLDSEQVNRIYESLESARNFFAPKFRTRKVGPTSIEPDKEK